MGEISLNVIDIKVYVPKKLARRLKHGGKGR
jgi:hypothetical protein